METANLMAVATKPAATKTDVKGATGKSSVKGKNEASFDDVLGKTSAQNDVLSKLTENEADSDADSSANDTKGDSAGKDLLSLLLTAMNSESNQPNNAVTAVPSDGSAAAVVDLSDQAVMELSAPLADSAPHDNLQTILPQNEQSLQENKNFLAMLSGQQIKKAALSPAADENHQPATAKATADNLAMTTPLEAELFKAQSKLPPSSQLLPNQLTAVKQENINLQTPAIAESLNESLADTADNENVVVNTQLIAETAVTADNTNVKENSNKISQVLNGASITVEDTQQNAVPSANLANLTDSEAQPDFSQEQDFNQQSGLSQQGDKPKMVIGTDKTSENAIQLPEEAAGDKVVLNQAQSTPTVVKSELTPFGQILRENIVNTPSSVQAPQSAPAANDDFNIPQQIVDQAKLIKRAENTEMVIKLNPEHLGELTLKVAVTTNGSVSASFHSDNVQVRTIIENSLVQLRSDLNQQGLKVDQVEVYAGLADGQLPQGEGQGAWQNQQGQQHSSNSRVLLDGQEYAAEADELADIAGADNDRSAKKDSVDYRI